jgi:HD superfamily phosphohydrolase
VHAFDAKQLILRLKVLLSTEEENALYIAILLHDIGHGPFHMPWKKLLKMS